MTDSDNGQEGSQAPEGQGQAQAAERPAWLPEKFATPEDLAKGYTELTQAFTAKTEVLRQDILNTEKSKWEAERIAARPEAADKYEVKIPEGILPPDLQIEIKSDDPLVGWWRETAFKAGLSQEDFQTGIGMYIKGQLSEMPDKQAELAKLGEKAEARINDVGTWLRSAAGERFDHVAAVLTTAGGVEAMEKIMAQVGKAPVSQGQGGQPSQYTEMEIRAMMDTKEYRAGDPATHEKVRNAWVALKGNKPHAA